jgi:glycine/D-amino acid oxidase-like deaminating enzyme
MRPGALLRLYFIYICIYIYMYLYTSPPDPFIHQFHPIPIPSRLTSARYPATRTNTSTSTMTRQILPVASPVPSYWLTPAHALADERSTTSLPAHADVAVVGAGMAGVMCAYYTLRGWDDDDARAAGPEGGSGLDARREEETRKEEGKRSLLLVDARALCAGATGRNGGHVKVQAATLAALPTEAERNAFSAYVHRVRRGIGELVRTEGLEAACEFEVRRSYDVFTSAEELARVKSVVDAAVAGGEAWVKDVGYLNGDMAEGITGIKDAVGAFSVPAVSFWPYRLVAGLLERMLVRWPNRLNVQMHTPVLSLADNSEGNVLETTRGRVRADKVVLATNAWTAGLLPQFKEAIIPIRGMASHHSPAVPIHPHLANTYNIRYAGKGVDYLNPRPDGGIVVGGGAWMFSSDQRAWYDNFDDSYPFSEKVQEYWSGYMQKDFLGWEDSKAVADAVWVGIMGRTPDGQPHVGRVPGSQSRWLMAGFNGGGMSIICTAAQAVAAMVRTDVGFDEVAGEFGLLEGFKPSADRLQPEDRK